MASKHIKSCSVSLVIRKMQMKTIMTYCITYTKMTVIKRTCNSNYWQGCERIGILIHLCWECKMMPPLWKIVWKFLKMLKLEFTIWLSNCTPRYIPNRNENIHLHIHSSIFDNSKKIETTQMSISWWMDEQKLVKT